MGLACTCDYLVVRAYSGLNFRAVSLLTVVPEAYELSFRSALESP